MSIYTIADLKKFRQGGGFSDYTDTLTSRIPCIGAHISIAASYRKAALDAHRIGANTMQIFTSSPRMWRASLPRPEDVVAFQHARAEHGIAPLVVHDNYLINLASTDPGIRAKSIAAYRGEVERALYAGADYLVAHPGSGRGQSVVAAIEAVARGLLEATQGLGSDRLMLLLENTAGQGAALGADLTEIAAIRDLARGIGFQVGYCLDTAHSFAAGYAIHEEAGFAEFVETVERILGWNCVPVIHANDSKAPFGSRVDRHQHIGRGHIGKKAFGRILRHPFLRDKAFILETPIEEEGDDARNIATLRGLCRGSSSARRSI